MRAAGVVACLSVALFVGGAVAKPTRFVGMTMAQFMMEAMVTPSDYFETGGKRVFIAYKPAPDPRWGCNMQLITRYSGQGNSADSWIIEQVRYSGGCDYF